MRPQLLLVSFVLFVVFKHSGATSDKPEWHQKKMAAWKALKGGSELPRLSSSVTAAPKKRSGKFLPTGLRCCKLGDKVARKQLSCNSHDYHPEALSGPSNDNRQRPLVTANQAVRLFMKKLSPKITRCLSSKYTYNFTKCCTQTQGRSAKVLACKRHIRKVDRRRCRKAIRKNSP